MPSTLQEYLYFVLCLLILAFTMALHVTLSAERMRLDQRLSTLKEEYARTERINANLVWQIAQSTSLTAIHSEAVARGYAPITDFKYVVADSTGAESIFTDDVAAGSPDSTDPWSVAPSADNPVIVLTSPDTGGTQASALSGIEANIETALVQTPGMQTNRSGISSGVPFTLDEMQAAGRETWEWIMERLPDWRFPWQ